MIDEIHRYSNDEIKKMQKLYHDGITFKEISRIFNTHKDSPYHILKRRGFAFTRNKNRKIKEEDIPKIILLYKEGLSTQQIAERFDVTKSVIRTWLKKSLVKLRSSIETNKARSKPIKPQNGMTTDKALLIGMLLADGSESNKANSISFACNNDKIMQNFAINSFEKIYGITGKVEKDNTGVVWHSQLAKEDLHKYTNTIIHNSDSSVHTPKEILAESELAKEFLKGYFSCDGAVQINIDKNGNIAKCLSTYSKNNALFSGLVDCLILLKIPFTTHKNFIRISTKKGIIRFHKIVGLNPVEIQKGKYWIGCKKDKLLEMIVRNFDKKITHFNSKIEGYTFLKNFYYSL